MKIWLDDVRTPPDDSWTIVRTAGQARRLYRTAVDDCEDITDMSLDHDLGACERCLRENAEKPKAEWNGVMPHCVHVGTGMDFLSWLVEENLLNFCQSKPVIHSMNPVGKAAMELLVNRHYME